MRIKILARKRSNYSNRRFREEAKKLGVKVSVTDPVEYQIALGRKTPLLYRNGKPFEGTDVILPRLGASITSYSLAVVAQFENMGIPVVNSALSILRTRDKLRCIQLLSRYDIDIPKTVAIRRPEDIPLSVDLVGGFPVILKLLSGTQGVGVMIAENMRTIESTLDTLWSLGQDILVQECVQESIGRDIRVIVVGGRIVAAMRRQARIGEFRSNIHRGGLGTPLKLPEEYKRVAVHAAKIVRLEMAGVDILESNRGPKVIEVNSSPGLEGIETATKLNVARAILEYAAEVGSQKSAHRA
ncbi:MAG: RimK family alpha-L-glutamate ligase [Pseudomonadota bacterium]